MASGQQGSGFALHTTGGTVYLSRPCLDIKNARLSEVEPGPGEADGMQDAFGYADGINTDLLKTLHETVGRGLGVGYALCDETGLLHYHHRDKAKSALHAFLEGDRLNSSLTTLVRRQVQQAGAGVARKVILVPGVIWGVAVAVPGECDGAFVFSGPFLSKQPLDGDVAKCATKLGRPCDRSFKTSLGVPNPCGRRISVALATFFEGVVAVVDHLYRESSAQPGPCHDSVFVSDHQRVPQLVLDPGRPAATSTCVRRRNCMQASSGLLMLIDEQRAELKVLVAHGIPKDEVAHLRFAMGEGIPGWVAMEGVPRLFLKGTTTNHSGLEIPAETSSVCVPLIAKDQVIGVLILSSPTDKENFDHESLNTAGMLASQAAIAIENARLYARLERKIEEMRAIYQLANEVNSSLDCQHVPGGSPRPVHQVVACSQRLAHALEG